MGEAGVGWSGSGFSGSAVDCGRDAMRPAHCRSLTGGLGLEVATEAGRSSTRIMLGIAAIVLEHGYRGRGMRKDMAQVIVERGRLSFGSQRKGRRPDLEDMPSHEGMRRSQELRGNPKYFRENLAPLRRYLASQVGRPWNSVFADITAHLRVSSAVQQHVRDHLHDFVAITPRKNIRMSRIATSNGLWPQEFYVDPKTGLLRRTDRRPKVKPT